MSLRSLWYVAIVGAVLPGCSAFNEYKQEQLQAYRITTLAKRAWNRLEDQYNLPYITDFERGFKAGYADVAAGGTGCPPILPPEQYWTVRYQNPEGHARVLTWYDGYREGAMVAEQDGAYNWYNIPLAIPDCDDDCETDNDRKVGQASKSARKSASASRRPSATATPRSTTAPERRPPTQTPPLLEEGTTRPAPPPRSSTGARPDAKAPMTPVPKEPPSAPKAAPKAAPPAVPGKPAALQWSLPDLEPQRPTSNPNWIPVSPTEPPRDMLTPRPVPAAGAQSLRIEEVHSK